MAVMRGGNPGMCAYHVATQYDISFQGVHVKARHRHRHRHRRPFPLCSGLCVLCVLCVHSGSFWIIEIEIELWLFVVVSTKSITKSVPASLLLMLDPRGDADADRGKENG
jgi:hypothetical protein